jgi:hypothetical protein
MKEQKITEGAATGEHVDLFDVVNIKTAMNSCDCNEKSNISQQHATLGSCCHCKTAHAHTHPHSCAPATLPTPCRTRLMLSLQNCPRAHASSFLRTSNIAHALSHAAHVVYAFE